MKLLTRFTNKLVAWVLPRPRLVLIAALVSVAASLWLATTRLGVQTEQLELISPRLPLITKSEQLDQFEFHGKTTFTLVVKASSQDRAIQFMKAIVAKIDGDPKHFQGVFYRVNPEEFKSWLLFYLDKADLIDVRNTIRDNSTLVQNLAENPDLLNFFKLVNQDMASKMVGQLFTGFLDEKSPTTPQNKPMDLDFIIKVLQGFSLYLSGTPQYVSPWSSFFKSGSWDLQKEGYLWHGKKKLLVAEVIPSKVLGEVSKTIGSLEQLRSDIGELQASGFRDVEAGVTGQEALNNDQMTSAMSDMTEATWLSLLGVVLIMAIFLRGFRHPAIIAVSLLVGLCWTFGWTALFIGHLNILSIVFAPMLCGLGVDYAIHWFARFEEERSLSDGSRLEIVKNVMDKSGPGIMLAGLSTAFSFLPFILTGFRGLMELGMITGMGILFIILADFTVLPALSCYLAVLDPGHGKLAGEKKKRYLLRLGPKGIRSILAAALLLSIAGGIGASRVHFDLDPIRLQAKNSESVHWEKVMVENADRSIISAAVMTNSVHEVRTQTEKFKALPTVSEVDNVFSLLPEDQEAKVPILRSIAGIVPGLKSTIARVSTNALDPPPAEDTGYKSSLIEVLERINFKMQPEQATKWGASKPQVQQMNAVRTLIGRILKALHSSSPVESDRMFEFRERLSKDIVKQWSIISCGSLASPMTIRDIPAQIRDQFYQNGQYVIRIYPKGSIWEEGALTHFVNSLKSVNPNVLGDPINLYVFSSAFKKASIEASVFALIAISLLLLFTFKSWRLMLISLVPLIVGSIWTVGLMGAVGFDFNLANSIFMPLVLGAGVEYGVIILYRWREGREGYGRLPLSTGKGLILAALTTTIGFGALMISQNPGIFSLGFVAWSGSICVLLAALLILPSILSFMKNPAPVSDKEVNDARS
ncbi:MAG: MMPL family transporter [Syntrophobacteraceae bacterium]|nr:MMPL family transporter [Syntrophobacteraceae bacterium]